MKKLCFVAALLCIISSASFAETPLPLPTSLPNPILTPGAVRTTDSTDPYICAKSKGERRSTKEIRKLLKQSEINNTYTRYHLSSHKDGQCDGVKQFCEVDHLISLELGGSPDNPLNLWPQPYEGLWNAHDKDKLENELHKQVCLGKLQLVDAQKAVATNWILTYQTTFKTLVPLNIGKGDAEVE